jgi:hypothetical protein
MTDFGDHTDADSFDTAPADPEQVAIRLHRLRQGNGLESGDWEDLDLAEQTLRIIIIATLLAWLRRGGMIR